MRNSLRGPLGALALLGVLCSPVVGQEAVADEEIDMGWEFTGFPALNFDSDEGFGYGAVMAVYDYGPGGLLPYRMSFQPTVFFTTKGRRELTLFFDAPHLLPKGWRLSTYLGLERHIATPYYGLGNQTSYDPELEEGDNPFFYRYGRKRAIARATLQRSLWGSSLRLLVGAQMADLNVDPTPKDEGATLLSEELGSQPPPEGWENSLRAGIIWDTRDRESGPTRGVWSEILVERVDEGLGSEGSYTRWTVADRRYFSIGSRLVFANRVVLQNLTGSPPFYILSRVQSSFGDDQALGGTKSIRGILKNRYVGEGVLVWNAELRWRMKDFGVMGKHAHLALVGFLDSGRVWRTGVDLESLLANLHHGVGGGIRLGLGSNFALAVDMGWSEEAGLQSYTGLGYLF